MDVGSMADRCSTQVAWESLNAWMGPTPRPSWQPRCKRPMTEGFASIGLRSFDNEVRNFVGVRDHDHVRSALDLHNVSRAGASCHEAHPFRGNIPVQAAENEP